MICKTDDYNGYVCAHHRELYLAGSEISCKRSPFAVVARGTSHALHLVRRQLELVQVRSLRLHFDWTGTFQAQLVAVDRWAWMVEHQHQVGHVPAIEQHWDFGSRGFSCCVEKHWQPQHPQAYQDGGWQLVTDDGQGLQVVAGLWSDCH